MLLGYDSLKVQYIVVLSVFFWGVQILLINPGVDNTYIGTGGASNGNAA